MEIRRVKIFILITSLFLCLTSCTNTRSLIASATGNPFEKIISAIQEKNTEDLKSLFSPNALKETNDFDGGAEYLFGFFQGDIISMDEASISSGSNHNGEKLRKIKYMNTVTTRKGKYVVFYINILEDTDDTDNVGLYMLQIIKEADMEKEFDWGNKTKCAGIYCPTTSTDSAIN